MELPEGAQPIGEHAALNLAMAACAGVIVLGKQLAQISTNPKFTKDLHRVMRDAMALTIQPDSYERTLLAHLFGPESTPD